MGSGAPRKLQLLGRGLGVFGSYAKLVLAGEEAVAYCQFGPLTAYPRAQRLRELYPYVRARTGEDPVLRYLPRDAMRCD